MQVSVPIINDPVSSVSICALLGFPLAGYNNYVVNFMLTKKLLYQRSRRQWIISTKGSRLLVFHLYDVYFNCRRMACQSPSGKYRTFCFNIISTLRTVQKLTQISLRPLGLRPWLCFMRQTQTDFLSPWASWFGSFFF